MRGRRRGKTWVGGTRLGHGGRGEAVQPGTAKDRSGKMRSGEIEGSALKRGGGDEALLWGWILFGGCAWGVLTGI